MIENDYFKVDLSSEGALTLTEKKSGYVWRSPRPFLFTYGNFYTFSLPEHCRMSVKETADSIDISFSKMDWLSRFKGHFYKKPDPGPKVSFKFSIALKDDEILFQSDKIAGMDDEPCRIEFPSGLLNWGNDETLYAIIPLRYGMLVDFPRVTESFCTRWGAVGVPVYGVMRDDGGMAVRMLDTCDMDSRLDVGSSLLERACLSSSFRYNKRFANYQRRLLYKWMPAGSDFVTVAKWYRASKINEGGFKSLKQKIEEHPDVEKLVGTVVWKHPVYSQKVMPPGVEKQYSLYAICPDVEKVEGRPSNWNAYELFDLAKKLGFDRLCVFNAGWNCHGYDSGYPTRFPTNPEQGTEEEFKRAAKYAHKLSDGYVYSVHDNYIDVYPNADEPIEPTLRVGGDGAYARGGIWRGGRASLMCPVKALDFAKRDIPRIAKMTGGGGIYIDVMGSSQYAECYSDEHPMSERMNVELRRKFFNFVKDKIGSVASEAVPMDDIADIVDMGAYLVSALEGIFNVRCRKAITIPFWQLVYHESVLGFTDAYSAESTANYHALCALFGLLPGGLDETSLRLSRELREAYVSEMTEFSILHYVRAPYCYVARSQFADGTEVIANMTDEVFYDDGVTVEAHGFVINHREN